MMYNIVQLSDLPAVVGTWHAGFRFKESGAAYTQEIHACFDALEAPMFYILDMSELDTVTFDGLVQATNSGTNQGKGTLHHSMNCGTILVSNEVIIQMAAQGLKSIEFGSVQVKVVRSLDEALNYVRSSIG